MRGGVEGRGKGCQFRVSSREISYSSFSYRVSVGCTLLDSRVSVFIHILLGLGLKDFQGFSFFVFNEHRVSFFTVFQFCMI